MVSKHFSFKLHKYTHIWGLKRWFPVSSAKPPCFHLVQNAFSKLSRVGIYTDSPLSRCDSITLMPEIESHQTPLYKKGLKLELWIGSRHFLLEIFVLLCHGLFRPASTLVFKLKTVPRIFRDMFSLNALTASQKCWARCWRARCGSSCRFTQAALTPRWAIISMPSTTCSDCAPWALICLQRFFATLLQARSLRHTQWCRTHTIARSAPSAWARSWY